MYLLLYKDGTFSTWRVTKPEKRDYQKGTRCYQVDPSTTLEMISDWASYGYPDVAWAKEIKEW